MKYEFKAFYGTTELSYLEPMKRETVKSRWPDAKPVYYDSFSYQVGVAFESETQKRILPVTRKICYKINGSKHKCDARCTNAKGFNCECSCGGVNHGSGNL